MIEAIHTPAMPNLELEAFFSEAGFEATVVERCPTPTCALCSRPSATPLPKLRDETP